MNSGTVSLEKEKIGKLILHYALPSVMGLVFYGVQNVIDGIIVGRFIGVEALAGVNMMMPMYVVIGMLSIMTGVGNQAVIGISLGKKDYRKAADALTTGGIFIFCALSVLAILSFLFSDTLIGLLGATERLHADAEGYLKGLMLLSPFIGYMFFSDCMIKISGHPRFALCIMTSTIIINTLLNLFFVLVCGMGTFGVGLATGIAFTLAVIPGFFILFNKRNELAFQKGRFTPRLLGEMLYNGSSEGLAEFSAGISLILFNYTLMEYAGPDGVAAFSVINYVFYLGLTVFIGVSDGIVPIISYNYGAGRFDRLKQVVFLTLKINLAIGLLIFLFVTFQGGFIISLFLNDPAVVRIAENGAAIYVMAFLLSGINILFSGVYTAIANAKYSLVISSLRGLVFIVAGLMVLPVFCGINGVWLTVPLAELGTCLVVYFLYRKTRGIIFNEG